MDFGEGDRAAVYGVFILMVGTVTMIFLVAVFGTVWNGKHGLVQAKADVLARHRSAVNTHCGPGYTYDDVVMQDCVPKYPAPLAMVGALMDSRFTACDVSFSAMMCGVVPSSRLSIVSYTQERFRALALHRLQETNDAFYHSCLTRGTPAAKRETAIEYRHIIDTMLGDLRNMNDLPPTWGRLNRAGLIGAPFRYHAASHRITLDLVAMINMVHDVGEGRIYQMLQAGPIAYNVVELQQRIQHLVSIGQKLKHHLTSVMDEPRSVAFRHLKDWDWQSFMEFSASAMPTEDTTIHVEDLSFVQWIIQDRSAVSLVEWRVWLEFCIAYQHQGHKASPSCLNNSLSLLPESVDAAILGGVNVPTAEIATLVRQLDPTSIMMAENSGFHSTGRLSPDRYDHNVNIIRSWRAIQDVERGVANLTLADMLPPLYKQEYGDISKWALFGTHFFLRRHGNLTQALDEITRYAWPLLPQPADRQHFFMVWAQAYCTANRSVIDDVLRGMPAFVETMGCHAGQGMYGG